MGLLRGSRVHLLRLKELEEHDACIVKLVANQGRGRPSKALTLRAAEGEAYVVLLVEELMRARRISAHSACYVVAKLYGVRGHMEALPACAEAHQLVTS